MPRFLDRLADRALLWSMRVKETGRFGGVALANLRRDGGSFTTTILSSLRLIQENDSRRYDRVTRHIAWIANQVNAGGAQYLHRIRTMFLQFEDAPELSADVLVALYAAAIVHEATHGVIESRGLKLSEAKEADALRMERLCVAEQNRFVARLSARDPERYPLALLHFNAEEDYWTSEWNKSRLQRTLSVLRRSFGDEKTGTAARSP